MRVGIDVGSTTIKCVVIDEKDNIIYSSYDRHFSQIVSKTVEILKLLKEKFGDKIELSISGSAGMGMAVKSGIPFVQEVYATRIAANKYIDNADVVIELGGEDAKILFLTNGVEVRMNGSCAGGTGAFIDQMSMLLNITPVEMNELAKNHEKIYSIASRCGVFAKSDIQPLINQGASKEDISASIFYAVVNQTIAGLAQGREIKGNVIYLGGPLTFLSELRSSFDKTLKLEGIFPENSLYYVAIGAALGSEESFNIDELINKVENYKCDDVFSIMKPLFKNKKEYKVFTDRHKKASIPKGKLEGYKGKAYLGIDAGSTTVKTVVIDEEGKLLFSKYQSNSGNPVPIIKECLEEIYEINPKIDIISSACTGYGEEIIKNAFGVDYGIVETIAHFTAAKRFMPNVDFIIDIGGQDIKCFKIRDGAIDDIFLNEACSSGCGSFIQTFANSWGYNVEEFSKLGLFADKPVDLGSRCTVFMNSSIKQAQKDGASIENISAGLSSSVVKNALYKVIRAASVEELGKNIVVQGGTFYNDAVLRAFEQELNLDVVRPDIAGLMGAYGSALYSMKKAKDSSSIITLKELKDFKHDVKTVNCGLCGNNCKLTVNTFNGKNKFIAGNKCERPIRNKKDEEELNVYEYKRNLISEYMKSEKGRRGQIGIPLGTNLYELLPFWHTFFSKLDFEVVVSPFSSRDIYLLGQNTIPSDTVCFPAKLMHGHIKYLVDKGIKNIFYPCMTYTIDEHKSDNHYNCPVIAYYSEIIAGNMPEVSNINYIYDYVGLHREKDFKKKMYEILKKSFSDITLNEVKKASEEAYKEYREYRKKISDYGKEILEKANKAEKEIIVLAGRPYHIDPEINHGIDKLLCSLGVAVVSEDSIIDEISDIETSVLNQWTYPARIYAAANAIKDKENINLVQLVSFGCGIDAISTDESRRILQKSGKIYTQIKIDEITNLGAVKIRVRSLLEAITKD